MSKSKLRFGIIKIETNGLLYVQEVSSRNLDFDALREDIKGYIEVVPVDAIPNTFMILNEEGKIMDLPINTIATRLYANPYDIIVGDVFLVTDVNPDPYEDPDLWSWDYDQAEKVLKKILSTV